MATEEEASDRGKYVAEGMKIALALIFLPLLPLAVAFNVLGIADRLSFLPGIVRGGGAVAGGVMLVYVGAVVGVVAGGGAVATGGDVPIIGGGDEPVEPSPTPTSTATPPPEPTPSPPTATPTPTAAPTPTAEPDPFARFETRLRDRLSVTLENETLTGVPILATEYRENDQGQTALWIVFWQCDEAQALEDQRIAIGNEVVNTVGRHEGEMPAHVRVYGVTNLVNHEDTTTYINTSNARAVYNREMGIGTYTDNWWERQHEPSQALNDTAYGMVVDESGQEQADDAFYDDHLEVSYCPGPAEVGTGSDAYDGN